MQAEKQAKELHGIARFLFDRAAFFWYTAISIEIIAGVLVAGMGLFNSSDKFNIGVAVVGFFILAASYYMKLRFRVTYENAETMRRQAVLSDALGWPVSKVQFSVWRQLAGENVLKKVDTRPLDEGYYATKKEISAQRLCEMSQESAFWTRHQYVYLRPYIWILFVVTLVFIALILTFVAVDIFTESIALRIVYTIYILLPLILSIDLLGWAFNLNRLIDSIARIENDMEHLEKEQTDGDFESKVLRLVSEYNCQVVSGFPIPSWFFRFYHDRIQELWNKNNSIK